MPTMTVPRAKNMLKRALYGLLDVDLTKSQVTEVWTFFESKCAYCGQPLDRRKKEGHIDHLVSSSSSGFNHISNRVLSCAPCNEKEKRDLPWDPFLRAKAGAAYTERRARIEEWMRRSAGLRTPVDPTIERAAKKKVAALLARVDGTVAEVRELASSSRKA